MCLALKQSATQLALLQVLLTKLRTFAARDLQLVCISATMGGLEPVVRWLDARLFMTNYRPVKLQEHLCLGSAVFSVDQNRTCAPGPMQAAAPAAGSDAAAAKAGAGRAAAAPARVCARCERFGAGGKRLRSGDGAADGAGAQGASKRGCGAGGHSAHAGGLVGSGRRIAARTAQESARNAASSDGENSAPNGAAGCAAPAPPCASQQPRSSQAAAFVPAADLLVGPVDTAALPAAFHDGALCGAGLCVQRDVAHLAPTDATSPRQNGAPPAGAALTAGQRRTHDAIWAQTSGVAERTALALANESVNVRTDPIIAEPVHLDCMLCCELWPH